MYEYKFSCGTSDGGRFWYTKQSEKVLNDEEVANSMNEIFGEFNNVTTAVLMNINKIN